VPRASKVQTQSHRRAITDASARLMRERGIKGVSVAELMGAAGLTHGGFYGHFASKEQLASEACTHAFLESVARWKTRVASQPDAQAALRTLIETYLSTRNRDDAGRSCPTVALACDVAREPIDSPVRAAFRSGTEQLIEVLTSLQTGADPCADRREALAQFSTLVGAVVLARATAGAEISDEILRAAREQLVADFKC
jgi:TetR/AcrR family transcriptional regulator, transcriptional repressor for nem operon